MKPDRGVRPILLLVAMLVSSDAWAATEARERPQAPDPLETRLSGYVTHPFRHGLPYDLATSFGPRAVPILTRWLADPNFKLHHPQVLAFLGYLGGPKEASLLRDYLLNRYHGDIDEVELKGLIAATLALGCLSDRDPTTVAFLEAAADPTFYEQAKYTNSLRGKSGLNLLLSKLAINALGLSARPEAKAALNRLEKRPGHPSQIPNISDALRSHSELVRVGRSRFAGSAPSGQGGQLEEGK